jgi:glyoxylase I family protein
MAPLRCIQHAATICPNDTVPKAFGVDVPGLCVVADVEYAKAWLESHRVALEPARVDAYTARRFTFFADPDGLPLGLFQSMPTTR